MWRGNQLSKARQAQRRQQSEIAEVTGVTARTVRETGRKPRVLQPRDISPSPASAASDRLLLFDNI